MTDRDPMLDGITRYWPDIEGRGVLRPVMRPIPEDFHPDDECVLFSDLPALLARVREDERRTLTGGERHREWWVAFGMGKVQGQRDEREACIAAVEAQKAKWSIDSEPALDDALAAIRAREEKP